MSSPRALRALRALTALLVALALDLVLWPSTPDALARPGGGQTFQRSTTSSPSRTTTSSPSRTTTSSPSRTSSGSTTTTSRSSSGSSSDRSSSSSSGGGVWVGSGSSTPSSGYSSGSGGYDPSVRPSSSYSCCQVVFVLLVLALIVYALHRYNQQKRPDWSTTIEPSIEPPVDHSHRHTTVAQAFAALVGVDPGFSRVLLEDFLYALYAEVQRSRGGDRLGRLAAYLSPDALRAYQRHPAAEVRDIVIGALSFESVNVPGPQGRASLTVRFIANYTEVDPAGATQAWYVSEVWNLSRDVTTPSRKPENARTIGCPSCGAPLDKVLQGVCTYCKAKVTGEQELDWRVDSIALEEREARGPMLTGSSPEQGGNLPTVFAPNLNAAMTALQGRDPAFDWSAFHRRVELIFQTFHDAWTRQDLAAMRPFLSDNLFELQTYWVQTYQKQGLRNVSQDPALMGQEICKVETDGHYDMITVRLRAHNVDFTVDGSGSVVGGDRNQVRQYTEYWTLIRGKEAHGAAKADRACPSCGAPSDQINMAGTCKSCGVKVTSGTFDWVLSRIEQDDVYSG